VAKRAIDEAMAADRPAKQVIRKWWIDAVESRLEGALQSGDLPYLTLPGALGLDVKLLIDRGLLPTTEAGQIDTSTPLIVVAFESSSLAVADLRATYPGLKVREQNLLDLIAGEAPDTFSTSPEHKQFARAAVVNLDFTKPWSASALGVSNFVTVVNKFAAVHEPKTKAKAAIPAVNWTLCLTLNARIIGSAEARLAELDFIADQVANVPLLKNIVDSDLAQDVDSIRRNPEILDLPDSHLTQRILSLLIPLRIIHTAVPRGWLVRTIHAARYGGGEAACMVSFIFDFEFSKKAISQPTAAIKDCHDKLAHSFESVEDDGTVAKGITDGVPVYT